MPGKRQDHSRWAIFLFMLWICLPVIAYPQEIQHKTLPDGVEHWYRIKQEKPWFFRQFEKISDVIVNRKPFGKSVAFLVGVSEYKNLPKLPFVKNDLDALRKFLLNRGGFDEVYVAADQVVTTRLVQGYMRNNPMKLQAEDRLLFYYSGHGADQNGKTGYMQFSEADPDKFDSEKYLAVKECTEWSSSLKFKHILFIYDCCVSGLAFTAKAGEPDRDERISATLKKMSDTGSRTVITAGTSEEKSFGVGDHSVFTEAFLKAFDNCPNTGGFITTDEIFSQIKRRVRDFCLVNDKQLTPRHWELEDHKYRGTFLFVDTSAKNIRLSEDVVKGLGIDKGSATQPQPKKPKYQLRKEPMTVSDEEFKKIFRLDEEFWRPIEYIENNFKDNGDGTITDYVTGLMWQKSGSSKDMEYQNAVAYIEKLNHKKFAGYGNWKLPTVDELKSLITKNIQPNGLYINHIFDDTQKWCWTSDRKHTSDRVLYAIDFSGGNVNYIDDSELLHIRAVRSLTTLKIKEKPIESSSVKKKNNESDEPDESDAPDIPDAAQKSVPQLPVHKAKYQLRKEPKIVSDDEALKVFKLDKNWQPLEYIQNDFKDNGDGTITDHATGLMWQKSGSPNDISYENAKAYVENLNREGFAGHKDWRFPTVDELKSLTQEKLSNDLLYINPIFDKKQSSCWTLDHRGFGMAWFVIFYFNGVRWHEFFKNYYVRAVRSLQ